jgi:hypothetical protein
MRSAQIPDASQITLDTPLRLAAAAALAFPNGGMTVSGLRKERDAKRLATELVAGKEYTTLRNIERMRAACRDLRKARVSTSSPRVETPAAASLAQRAGSSATAPVCTPQDALLTKLQTLINPLPNTSAKRTARRAPNVVSLTSHSRTS